jgi:DNA-binding IclR family transcriptional regulator
MTSLLRLPPPAFSELAWDVLLALHGHKRGQWGLARLSCLVSAPPSAVNRALATLESLQFVTARPSGPDGQRRHF